MSDINLKPFFPKNKVIPSTRHVLSKFSSHLTIATPFQTSTIENLDPIVNHHIRKLLEVLISGTLTIVYLTLSYNKIDLNTLTPITKFVQCQSTFRNALTLSLNECMTHL